MRRTTFFLFFVLCVVYAIKFNRINNSSSLLFQQSYDVSIPYAYRDIEISLEINEFLNKIVELKDKLNDLDLECSNFPDNVYCEKFQSFLGQHFNGLINSEQALIELKRQKRFSFDPLYLGFSPFQFIINQSQNLNPFYSNILNESLIIQQKTISNLTESIIRINKQLSTIELNMKSLQLNDIFQFYMTIILDYTEILNNIFEIIYNKNTFKIVNIVRFANIAKSISYIEGNFTSDEAFFAKGIIEIIKTGKIQITLVQSTIKILIRLPIKNRALVMKSYEIISLPFFDGEGKISHIRPTFDYILFDENSKKIFGLFASEFQSCELFSDVKVCYQIKLHIDEQNCEIGIFGNSSIFSCAVFKTNESFALGKMNDNTFYCITKEETLVTTLCLGFQYYHFNESVIFSIQPGCTLIIRDQRFYIPDNVVHNVKSTIIPNYKLLNITYFNNHIGLGNEDDLSSSSNNLINRISELRNKTKQLTEGSDVPIATKFDFNSGSFELLGSIWNGFKNKIVISLLTMVIILILIKVILKLTISFLHRAK